MKWILAWIHLVAWVLCGSLTLESYHGFKTANNFKSVLHGVPRHVWQHLADGLGGVLGTNTLSGAYSQGLLEFVFVDVNSNDPGGASCLAAHDDGQANSSQAEHSAGGARADLCRGKFLQGLTVKPGKESPCQEHKIQRMAKTWARTPGDLLRWHWHQKN